MLFVTGEEAIFAGMVLVDECARPKNFFEKIPEMPVRPPRHRWRPRSELPEEVIQLRPPQEIRNQFLVDYIARTGTREIKNDETGDIGWSWAFDPAKDANTLPDDRFPLCVIKYLTTDDILSMKCRRAMIFGSDSFIVGPEFLDYNRSALSDGVPCVHTSLKFLFCDFLLVRD